MRRLLFGKAYCLEIVKLGLVMGSFTPNPLARPRTKVVLPAPTSPMSSITAGATSFLANCSP